MAEAAKMEPTERSMPAVRMTKVMPAASTVLIAACCSTIEALVRLKKPFVLDAEPNAEQDENGQHARELEPVSQAAACE